MATTENAGFQIAIFPNKKQNNNEQCSILQSTFCDLFQSLVKLIAFG